MKKALHGIRGLMALCILLSHCGYLINYLQTERLTDFLFGLWGAVTFFFICSGYFMELTKREEPFSVFIVRKLRKIYPLHILTLLVSVCMLFFQEKLVFEEDIVRFGVNLFLLQAWVPNQTYYFSFNAVSWFLSSLLGCYIIGWFLLRKKISLYCFLMLGYGLQIIFCMMLKTPQHWLMYINPIFRSVDFCLGIWLCQILESNKYIDRGKWIWTIGEVCSVSLFIGAALLVGKIGTNYTYNLLWLIPSACIIIFFSIEKGFCSELLKKNAIQVLGSLSLEIFLTHKFIINNVVNMSWFIKAAERSAIFSLLIVLVICLGLAGSLHYIVIGINDFIVKIKNRANE